MRAVSCGFNVATIAGGSARWGTPFGWCWVFPRHGRLVHRRQTWSAIPTSQRVSWT